MTFDRIFHVRRALVAVGILAFVFSATASIAQAQPTPNLAASAAPSIHIVSARWQASPDGITSHPATCETGWTAIGGGVVVSAPAMMHLITSRKTADPREWLGSVRSIGPPGAYQTFDTYAVCAQNIPTRTAQKIVTDIGPGKVAEVSVYCEKGTTAIGGGQDYDQLPYYPSIAIEQSASSHSNGEESWGLVVHNTGMAPGNFTAHVVCTAPQLPGQATASAYDENFRGRTPVTLIAQCPPGKRAFGGGGSSFGGAVIASSYPTNDGTAWATTFTHLYGDTGSRVRATAECAAL